MADTTRDAINENFVRLDALQAAADEAGIDLTLGEVATIMLALEAEGWQLQQEQNDGE